MVCKTLMRFCTKNVLYRDLLQSPDAGLSLFDAKVAQERSGGRETLGDIA